ncbi:hypothetical protein [Williamsia soli]|uniref:AraC-like ligand-binding domain-containing protein n=1 Tax=Williamsia soli TaxID=364929 RepID=UPI0027DC545D|nr:hypothetical protein [Williamsia soli]
MRLNHLTIGRARFGSEARVDPGDLGTYHVNVPVSGEVVSWCGDKQTVATPRYAAVRPVDRRRRRSTPATKPVSGAVRNDPDDLHPTHPPGGGTERPPKRRPDNQSQ